MKTVETSINIDAPIELVWEQLSDLKAFNQWNTRTLFNADPKIGQKQTMRVWLMRAWLKVPVTIQNLDANEQLRWIGGIPGVYTGSHYFKLSGLTESQTRLVQGEDFKGVFVPLMWPFLKRDLMSLYESFNEELKQRCEQVADSSQ